MAKTATSVLERFIADLREVFGSLKDPRAQTQAVALHMERVLAIPGWLEGEMQARGESHRADLHLDPDYGHPGPGFLVMCSLQQATREPSLGGGLPHDHGASWVVYGVYQGAIEQTTYRWVYPEGQWTSPRLTQSQRFVQRAGEVAFFLPGEIHKTVNAAQEPSLVLRVEGQKLDRVARHRYDPDTNSARLVAGGG